MTLTKPWQAQFKTLKLWVRKHPGCWPSQAAASKSEMQLARWMNNQRQGHRNAKLCFQQVQLLEDLPAWTWSVYEDTWHEQYVELQGWLFNAPYSESNPCRFYPTSTPPACDGKEDRQKESPLGRWVEKQRFLQSKGKLSR